jgi:uncharacterized Zn finger protein/superfamily II DNA or RNA helicase
MARVQYGVTPWGKWFMDVLESYRLGARLDRGKTYANTGKVLGLEIKGRRVAARIKGHYKPFYHVEIGFPLMTEQEQNAVKAVLENDAALLARIASGELPEEFLEELKKKGIALIPKRWQDMQKTCDCPDSGGYSTCKHIAALYFVLARAIDAEPDILFKLRGIDLKAIEEKAGAALAYTLTEPFTVKARGKKAAAATTDTTGARGKKAAADTPDTTATPDTAATPDTPATTDTAGAPDTTGARGKKAAAGAADTADTTGAPGTAEEPAEFPLGAVHHCAAFITSLLPAAPPFCTERDFSIVLGEFYHHVSRRPLWSAAPSSEEEEKALSRSRWSVECKRPGPLADMTLIQEDIHGALTRHDVYDLFLTIREHSIDGGTRSYRFLCGLFKFLTIIITSCAFIPRPFLMGGRLGIVWLVFEGLSALKDTIAALCKLEDGMLKLGGKGSFADGRGVFDLLSSAVLAGYVRRAAFRSSGGGPEFRNLCLMFFEGGVLDVSAPAFRSVPQAIGRYLTVLYTDFSAYRYRVTLKDYARDPELLFKLSMSVLTGGKNIPLKDAAKKTGSIDVLKAPTALSNYLPEIRQLLVKPSVTLDETRLAAFLDEASALLARLGIEVILPKNLHRELKPRLVLSAERNKAGGALVSYLDLPSLLTFEWRVAIGDETLSAAEFNALVKQKRQVVQFKDRFIRIDPDELANLFKAASRPAGQTVSANDFLKAHFAGDTVLSASAQTLLGKVFDKKDFPPPDGLCAQLRPYQLRGCNWALSLLYAGFGCIIADDMGLGKTIQAIAVLLRLKMDGFCGGRRSLIVAPAALLENWDRELRRFAPSLTVRRYHGKERALADGADVFLTTYQTAVRDKSVLCGEDFALLIVDEAHLLKNAQTHGSKTVKALRARFKVALSGTPVENRLEDLRSLFDFVLPGYLGGPEQFRDEFRRPIEVLRDKDAARRLRKITSPFLLRRLKTDKSIIGDLPEKITTDEYAALEKEQAALYESVVKITMEKLERLDDKESAPVRNALILQLLTSLKQICGHPRVYDKESPAHSKLSGKATLLLALLEEILGGGERVLIFSQYVETLECLAAIIRDEAGEAALLYHGGMSQAKRAAVVDAFQNGGGANILLVSLRAGGLGLNLTAASRVIHYDLWYNPAVEAQATDRAFRIGQKRTVFVHRLITRNSFEEKIYAMLKSKKELAGMTVSSGESWLASMSQSELRALFSR